MASSIPEHGSSKESFNKKWYKVEDDTSNICEECASYAARKQHKKPFYISNSRASFGIGSSRCLWFYAEDFFRRYAEDLLELNIFCS